MAHLDCAACGTRNSAFNPKCIGCGASLVDAGGGPPSAPRERADAASERSAERWIGATLGRWRVEAVLASGSTGVVLLARDEDGGAAAIKLLHARLAEDAEIRRRLAREARALAGLDHPCVARLIEPLTEPPGLVLEHLSGETLEARLARAPLSVPEAARVLGAVADGVTALHALGVVHRDLKPANVVLGAAGAEPAAKVIDLGLVRFLEASPGTLRTAIGTVLGSLAYSAPEVVLGEVATPACDAWSLGIVLYEALAGRRPFEAPTRRALATQILSADPPRLTCPAPLAALIHRLLAKEPSARPGLAEVGAELEAWG